MIVMRVGSQEHGSPPAAEKAINMLRRMIAIKQVPWLVLVVSLTATMAVWHYTRTDVLKHARVHFYSIAQEYRDDIIDRMRNYETVLYGGVGLFDASDDEVSRDSWRRYLQALHIEREFPGTRGVGFSKRISPREKASHVRQVRAKGFPEVFIWPEERSEYTSVIFLEPFSGRNLRSSSYDMFSDPVRRAAMERARDEGSAMLSGKVIPLQETDKDKQNGILMYAPVYRRGMPNGNVEERRAALTGYVYCFLRVDDLMDGVLRKAVGKTDIVIYDGKEESAENLLYANGAEKTVAKERGNFRSAFTETLTFDLYGRTWTIRFGSLPPLEATIDMEKPLYVLFGGIGISLLLFGTTFALALRYKALARIKEAEEALREANIRLETRILERTADLSKTNELLRQEIVLREKAEEQIRKSLHRESALRKTNEKILSGINFNEVFGIACDAIVEMGYRMCWIGLAEADYTVRPIAARGFDEGYLETIRVRWDESPEGRGPSGIAIRTGRLCVIQDLQGENLYAPWREKAIERGYLSSAAFPMVSGEGEAIGVLNVYAGKEEAFDEEEISRLEMFSRQCAIAIISARRLEELRDTSRRLAFHVNRMPLGYIAHDREFRIVGWNPAAERIFGWSAEEVKGKHPFELFVPLEMQAHVSGIWAKLREGEESSRDSVGPAIRKDGTTVDCEWFRTPLRDVTGAMTGLLTMVHDVTEKTRLEKQLLVAQKMESVGTLAGGIAHDFNNSLTGIVGFGELLRMRMAGDEQALHDLDEIQRCAERAATLTRQLLTFARRQVTEPVNLNLNTVVADLMKLIGKVVGEHIEVKTSLEKNVPTIHADRGQIEQVLMNLCLNARDAMPEGGRLTVETGDVDLEEEYVRRNPYMKPGRYALLTVSDTGVGMDEKTRERVFEPFFTTKGPDKGTGLGLAMVYGIVKQHGGFIHLYSEPGKGTAFKVYFPAIEAQPDAVPTIRREEILRGGMETILLAEDEESIRSLVERTLKELGYTVLVARNGEEAIGIFKEHKEIALAVLDVVMPRKGGKEAFEEMYKQNPRLKVIFMSGYSANAIRDSFVLIPGMPFLQKPFGPTILARKVREVLDTQ